ncbi:MAG: FAD-binding domain-containing protein, partial [Chitinophagaceae bacterium]
LMNAADADERHYRFIYQSIVQLQQALQPLKHQLYIAHAEALDVFHLLQQQYDIEKIFSHQEIGNALSFERDKSVKKFCNQHQIVWKEFPTNGIIRGLKSRNHWNQKWFDTMEQPIIQANIQNIITENLSPTLIQQISPKALPTTITKPNPNYQPGGFLYAQQYLQSFLNARIHSYIKGISKPLESRKACSRLSPYFTYGNVSIRQVYQAAKQQTSNKRNTHFFISRLLWHCHFIQKFESQYSQEFHNVNTAFNSIRNTVDEVKLQAFIQAKTGIPIVDASILCLHQTGYINFRMRSMLVSFATQHLWLPWQAIAPYLAKWFLDYEPGIHYPQIQMQAGTTGTNTIRMYNPVKQGLDHDAKGIFVKQWLPQLQLVPEAFTHQPHTMSLMDQQLANCIIGKNYPAPIINIATSAAYARDVLWTIKKSNEAKQQNKKILQKLTQRKTEQEATLQFE